MSAPVIERPRAGAATRTAPPAQRRSSTPWSAKRRPGRTDPAPRRRLAARTAVRTEGARRASFVLTVMALLGAGLIATLWLSTAAAADSYRLKDARTAARDLSERSEQLHREVAALQSPPALAQRATALGMVPAKDPARLVVAPDGSVQVVGVPSAAVVPPPAAVPGGLAGAVAPPTRTVTAPEAAPQEVAAAAVAAAKPVVEAAVEAEEEAAGEDGTDNTDATGARSAEGTADEDETPATTRRSRTSDTEATDADGDATDSGDTRTGRATGRTSAGGDTSDTSDTAGGTAGTTRTRTGTG